MEELLAIIGIITLPLSIIFGIAWWNARKELRLRQEIARDLSFLPYARANVNAAVASSDTQRLEQAVEGIALEVERLAEAQRFVAKVLSERSSAERGRERPPVVAPPNVITPH